MWNHIEIVENVQVQGSETGEEGSPTLRTFTFLKGVDGFSSIPSEDGITSIYSQLSLLYVITSIIIGIVKVTCKLNYQRVNLHKCALNNLVALKT